jgi:hypothetical protein
MPDADVPLVRLSEVRTYGPDRPCTRCRRTEAAGAVFAWITQRSAAADGTVRVSRTRRSMCKDCKREYDAEWKTERAAKAARGPGDG